MTGADYETEKAYREAIANLEEDLRSAHARIAELERKLEESTSYAISEASKLRGRIRELTEWRPIETAPFTTVVVLPKNGIPLALHHAPRGWEHGWTDSELVGWLPLPEVTP